MSDNSTINESIAWFGKLLDIATCAVVVGLLFEYIQEFRSLAANLWGRNWRWARTTFLHIIGPILVVGGVAGELYAQFHVTVLTQQYETNADDEIVQLNDDSFKLESAFSPRGIWMNSGTIASLAKFTGQKIRLQVAPEFETLRLGNQLYGLLNKSGWNITSVMNDPDRGLPILGIRDGVNIFLAYRLSTAPLTPEEIGIATRTTSAADVLEKVLETVPTGFPVDSPWIAAGGNIHVERHQSELMKIGLDEMVVTVGMRSAASFDLERESKAWEKRKDRFLQEHPPKSR